MKSILNERGISLVEVVASLVIITIIFISFFGLFIQSKKTNVHSEGIHDATYIAQKAMEEIYIASRNNTVQSYISSLNTSEIKACTEPIDKKLHCLQPPSSIPGFESFVTISSIDGYESNVTRILIEVYEENNANVKAIVENVYIWN